jgi:hypothetical protein
MMQFTVFAQRRRNACFANSRLMDTKLASFDTLQRHPPVYRLIQPLTSQSELCRLWAIILENAGELILPMPPEYTKYAMAGKCYVILQPTL